MKEKQYQVFDNNKPADVTGYPQLTAKCWKQSVFPRFALANEYANYWIDRPKEYFLQFVLNKPCDYSGYGDIIEIREV